MKWAYSFKRKKVEELAKKCYLFMLVRERMVDPFLNETFLEKKEQKGVIKEDCFKDLYNKYLSTNRVNLVVNK